jgi:BASS family bile acid:Na+ symporter
MTRTSFFRLCLWLAAAAGLLAAGTMLWGKVAWTGPAVITAVALVAIALQLKTSLRTYAFSLWVIAFVSASMFYPEAFRSWGTFQLQVLIVPLIQLIMFGMGTTLSVADFGRVLKMPRAVLIGMLLQFTVMPVVGVTLATVFGFEPAVAAGVVLIGSCPGGVASNVMTFLARGSVALSVTMTACSTLASPLMTPLMMKLLAGRMIEVDFLTMMKSIVTMIIVPIVAGLIVNKILSVLRLRGRWMDRLLSVVAMAGICFIIAIITSLSRDKLLTVGLALIAAAVLHNGLGSLFGYGGARLLRLDESSCRTVAIEVGLQNGGMASGLAISVLQSSDAALAPAIFGPWMNISGSILASWWRGRPVSPESDEASEIDAADKISVEIPE